MDTKKDEDVLGQVKTAINALDDKKAMRIITLDVRDESILTDYVIIAEGSVNKHVKALADSVEFALKQSNIKVIAEEGRMEGDWVILDYMDFVIHLFTKELRTYYNIEQLWPGSKLL